MKKKLFSLLLVFSMLITCLVGCNNPTQQGGENGLIGVCMQNMSSSISVLQSDALKAMFEPMGYEVQVVSADDSVSTQMSQIQNFILMGAKMLVVLPCEIETLEDSLIQARQQGIKVVISGGTGTISEEAYDAVSSDDEYVIGLYVASVAKTWVEANMDPNGDWDVEFLTSTISVDAKARCAGMSQIVEPYLKNQNGEYINIFGDVVSEAEKIENPVYCKMIADRVANLADSTTEMDISGDNKSVVMNVLTENPKARIFIAYNSLASVAGSQYVMDTYSAEEQKEFGFFSGGVMGNEYEYLIGSVSKTAGTQSVFRAACQFGGGDAAATLANLAKAVMTGEAGKDYGKSNPNSIGLFFPIAAELNNGVEALVCFDTSSKIEAFTFEQILAHEGLMTYWDAKNGYNENMKEDNSGNEGGITGPVGGGDGEYVAYTYEIEGFAGKETLEFDLYTDGTCKFYLPGNTMIVDVYAGTYQQSGNVVKITGLTNVDPASEYKIPGLWSDIIDPTTGDAVITIDETAKTFVPGGEFTAPEYISYTCEIEGFVGKETLQFDLYADGTCKFYLPGNAMITDVYAGTYTKSGNVVSIKALTNVDAASEYKIPGLWSDIINPTTGDATITIDETTKTFVAGGAAAVPEQRTYTYAWEGPMGTSTTQIELYADGTCKFYLPGHAMITDVYAGTYTQDGATVTIIGLSNVDTSAQFSKPGLWEFIDGTTGNCVVTVDDATGTYAPVK